MTQPIQASDFPNKWAILVGVTQYQNVKPLEFCGKDAFELARVLENNLKFDPSNILEIHHEAKVKPERDHILNQLNEYTTTRGIGENDLLIFFFSGHGVINPKDKKDYVLPVHAALGTLEDTGIRVERIIDYLKQSNCNNIVMFIDACRDMSSGEKGAKGIASIGDDSKKAALQNGIITFFSCNPTDSSYEIEKFKHGSFTYCLLEAIKSGKYKTVEQLDKYLGVTVPTLNTDNGKPTQQPYVIVEPLGKKNLAIFASIEGSAQTQDKYEAYIGAVSSFFAAGQLQTYFHTRAIEVILRAQQGNVNELFLRLIDALVSGEMTPEVFMVTWRALEKGQFGASPIKKDRGPIR